MTDVFDVAAWTSAHLTELEIPHMFIGGIAVQAWGESRVTRDVDLSVLARFGDEKNVVDKVLSRIRTRLPNATEHALKHRVLLCQSEDGIGIDIGLAAFPYEEDALKRSAPVEMIPGITLPLISPSDLVITKVFAGRPRDWDDVVGIVRRQRQLDWSLIERNLSSLLELIEDPERLGRLLAIRESDSDS